MFWILLQLFFQLPEWQTHASEAPGSIVEWKTEKDHDFGKMKRDHPQTFVFKFVNTLNEPFFIENVRTTCGCTAATWTEGMINGGQSGEITIEYDAYQRGSFQKKIRVFFNKQRKPEILWIRGVVAD
ncbi:MAG: DUF1573 domain-containing protein [Chitinophagales bacterium]|nr:DUF1573 domain-containing protein [Chitinophagales bacterium]